MFVNGRRAAVREESCAMNPDLLLPDLTDTDFTINNINCTRGTLGSTDRYIFIG